jgi:hypothetical protein
MPIANEKCHAEFYHRYYQPFSLGLGNAVAGEDFKGPLRPKSSPDRALTAFAQLATLRLDCKRSLITFFDRNHQYHLAEATRTTPLQRDVAPDPGDELRYGTSITPKKGSICEHVLSATVNADGCGKDDVSVFVVPDLRQDKRFCNAQYCTLHDYVFYAGVAIVSPSGRRIGAFCV